MAGQSGGVGIAGEKALAQYSGFSVAGPAGKAGLADGEALSRGAAGKAAPEGIA